MERFLFMLLGGECKNLRLLVSAPPMSHIAMKFLVTFNLVFLCIVVEPDRLLNMCFQVFSVECVLANINVEVTENNHRRSFTVWPLMQDIFNKGGLAARDWFDKRLCPR